MTTEESPMDDRYVALLRGINVGGNNKLPMKDLAAMVAAIGGHSVRTYIQSGNVVFGAPPAIAPRLPELLSAEISSRSGLKIPVVVRSRADFERVASQHPFLTAEAEHDKLAVMFLADAPTAEAVARLDPARSADDVFRVIGHEVFLYYPNGMGNSKLTNQYFDRTLGTTSTVRNWRTVLKIRDILNA